MIVNPPIEPRTIDAVTARSHRPKLAPTSLRMTDDPNTPKAPGYGPDAVAILRGLDPPVERSSLHRDRRRRDGLNEVTAWLLGSAHLSAIGWLAMLDNWSPPAYRFRHNPPLRRTHRLCARHAPAAREAGRGHRHRKRDDMTDDPKHGPAPALHFMPAVSKKRPGVACNDYATTSH